MIEFSPAIFESQFRDLVERSAPDDELDAIDDALQQAILGSNEAKACAYLAVEILSGADRPWGLASALNTAFCASCFAGDTERARSYLRTLVDLTIESGMDQAALSAAGNVRLLLPGNSKPDHVPHMLYEVVRLYIHLKKHEEAIENLIVVAHLLADFGAYQSAYRSLADAEGIARENRLPDQFINTLSAAHAIALLEEDHAYAEDVWSTLGKFCNEAKKPVPIHLAVNRATALFQMGRLNQARTGFEDALLAIADDTMRFGVLINLSACLRELGERDPSDELMAEARQILARLERVDPELPLEMELVAAKNAAHNGDLKEVGLCLNRAVRCLDEAVGLVEKLHYRRGLRERYVSRIEHLLVKLPPTGRVDMVVAVLAGTRANRLSDWLQFLDWTRELARHLSEEGKAELDRFVYQLANHGAPHLFGYREKYDDPMAPTMMPDPWRDISEYVNKVCARYGVGRPFDDATSKRGALLIKQRLSEGYAVLVSLLTADHKMLLLFEDRYIICDLPLGESQAFLKALYRHRHEPHQAKALGLAVNAYQAALLQCLEPVLREMMIESCKGLIFVPDKMDLMPINLVMIGQPQIRAKMAAGQFEVRTCLALYPAQRHVGAPTTSLGIIERESNLRYDRRDIDVFFTGTRTVGTVLQNPTPDEFAAHMSSSDSLILSHHGMSVGIFTDPHFADLSGAEHSSAMSLAGLQETAYRWPYRLVILGTCHSGSFVNRNFQGGFKSHDLTGFPSTFLINGQSEVIAASWAILDRFNLLFTSLLAPALSIAPAALAASMALAELFEMPDENLVGLLQEAFPAASGQPPPTFEQINNLRHQPFCYGAYQTYTLL